MKSEYTVLKNTVLTEKASRIMPDGKYVFSVSKDANKIEIKRAVEKIYKVKVVKVASLIIKGKTKKVRANQPGKKTDWKKAVVTLKTGQQIQLT